MRYAVVVSSRVSYASRFASEALASPTRDAKLAAVVLCRNENLDPARRRRLIRRRLRKALRIGVVGTLNGLRMRRWYGALIAEQLQAEDIATVCARRGLPLIEIANFYAPEEQRRVRALELDLAVSMGNGYIPRAFFSIPRLGMLNVHHEVLPRYRGAQTALWQIHDGSTVSGFSIHEMTEQIDGGRILRTETVPLRVSRSLRDTVVATSVAVQLRSIEALLEVLDEFEPLRKAAGPNVGGATYTTPDTRALVRIYRNWLRLARAGNIGS